MDNQTFISVIKYYNEDNNKANIPSINRCENIISKLGNIKRYLYDICKNHCVAYTGPYECLLNCSLCGTRRSFNDLHKFQILSPSDILSQRFQSDHFCKLLDYKKVKSNQNIIHDIWQSKIIKHLRKKKIVIDGNKLKSYHFEDFRESAIGLATDGINIFKSQRKSCWPILLIDYNLPPHLRMKKEFIVYLGVVPGLL